MIRPLCILFFILNFSVPLAWPSEATVDEPIAREHWLYKVIPPSRKDIRWCDFGNWCLWSLFGNDDDGIFGEKPSAHYNTRRPIGLTRAIAWTIRNPLHNFTFYVIGSAYRKNSEFTLIQLSKEKVAFLKYQARATTVFAGKKNGFYLGFHGWKPFISLRLDYGRLFEFYFGWRERGNFGIKFLPARNPHKQILEKKKHDKKNHGKEKI